MSNAYVFEDAPAPDGGGFPADPAGPVDGDDGSSPVPFVLLLITALILAAVIVLLLVRCCDGSGAPEVALDALRPHAEAFGGAR